MMAASLAMDSQRVPHFLGGGRIGWHERPVPSPAEGELLLRVRANALCGTDRMQLSNESAVTPGHESAGEVVAAGPGTKTPMGTLGVVYLMAFCGVCASCADGATNQCLAKMGDAGFTQDGGYGRFQVVREASFFPVDGGLSPREATLLLDALGTTSHALSRALMIRPEPKAVLIAGAGPVGLGMIAAARLRLGDGVPVVAADMSGYRLALAGRLGAIPVDPSHASLAEVLRAAGVHDGVEVAVDTSGRESARRQLLGALGRRGVLVCVGHGERLTLSVSDDLIGPERTIMGSEYFRFDELPAIQARLLDHRAYVGQIVTHRFGIEELETAYRLFLGGETGKVVIEQ